MNKRKIKVLVVDDDAEQLEKYCQLVRQYGYQVAEDSGDSVEQAVEKYQPHLVLMDTNLVISHDPWVRIFGFDVCASLRNTERGKNIGIIGMSVYFPSGERWKKAGADDFLDKAQIAETLKSTLEEVLRKYHPEYKQKNRQK